MLPPVFSIPMQATCWFAMLCRSSYEKTAAGTYSADIFAAGVAQRTCWLRALATRERPRWCAFADCTQLPASRLVNGPARPYTGAGTDTGANGRWSAAAHPILCTTSLPLSFHARPSPAPAAASHYVVVVRQETSLARPRVRAEGVEPFVCPEHGFTRHKLGGWRFRVVLPAKGLVTPMTGEQWLQRATDADAQCNGLQLHWMLQRSCS